MIRAVLDTNVLVSGLLRRHPAAPSVQLLDAWRGGDFELVLSSEILAEVERTLGKPYFRARLSDDQIERALTLLRRRSHLVPVSVDVQSVATHPEDDLILATAISGPADYLVTGDRDILDLGNFRGIEIKSPRDFLNVLQSSPP